jgi:hypothetical protein
MRPTRLLARVFLTIGVIFTAESGAQVEIDVAPPPPRVEVPPPPRPNLMLTPGYWQWRNGKFGWIAGKWITVIPGYQWLPSRWVHDGTVWRFQSGEWANVQNDVVVARTPPPDRDEPLSPSAAGYLWVKSHWGWDGQDFVWIGGRWEPLKPGQIWVESHWRAEGKGHWRLVEGHWEPQGGGTPGVKRD